MIQAEKYVKQLSADLAVVQCLPAWIQ